MFMQVQEAGAVWSSEVTGRKKRKKITVSLKFCPLVSNKPCSMPFTKDNVQEGQKLDSPASSCLF